MPALEDRTAGFQEVALVRIAMKALQPLTDAAGLRDRQVEYLSINATNTPRVWVSSS
jgi:hypothetical protein